MQQYRKCCTHPIGVSVYKWVSERGSRSAAADVAFQRELVEFIRRKICSPCHAGSSESRTVNRSALMENNGSPSIYSSRYRTNWGVGLASTPQRAFPEPAEPTGLMTLHAFSVSDCYAESSTPRPCVTDVGDAGPWIAHRAVPQRSCWRDLYGGICTAFATRCQIHRYFGNAYSREMADLLDERMAAVTAARTWVFDNPFFVGGISHLLPQAFR